MKFGFIGVGNMGGALAIAAAKTLPASEIAVASRTAEKAEAFAAKLGCRAATNAELAKEAKFLFLGVKPQMMGGMLAGIAPVLAERNDVILVSMAAGLTMATIETMAGGSFPVIRIMPNTPSAVGKGMISYAANQRVSDADLAEFLDGMCAAGMLDPLPEHLIDAGSAVSGCGPAFACQFVEALADGGVACGLPRAKAITYAAQMLLGTATLILESGQHPGALKDAVCSPGGSTIQGVRTLEERAFRGAVTDAVIAAYEKNKQLG